MEFVLQTRNLTKRYKDFEAVKNVNMHVMKGDIYGFIGPNGAGKTTIIRLVTGLAHPTAGEYKLFGTRHDDQAIYLSRRRLSAIVENPSLYQNLSAYENLLIHCKTLGVEDVSIIDETLDVVGLGHLKRSKKKVKALSLGMRKRLGIALALLGNPDFILLDEPMNGLDPEGIIDMREIILRLNREQNITFLISSHILDELSKIATKYGFIKNGNLIKEISAQQLEEECQQSIELKVSAPEKALEVLKSKGMANVTLDNGALLRINGDVDIAQVVTLLTNNGVTIHKIHQLDESIEDYYLKLMGGKQHV